MATFTLLAPASVFPDGTEVGVYPSGSYPSGHDGPPLGTLIDSDAIVNGSVTFSSLISGTSYWAAAEVSGTWRKTSFRTDTSIVAGGEDTAAILALEASIQAIEAQVQAIPDAETMVEEEAVQRAAADDAIELLIGASGPVGYVNHADDETVERPVGYDVLLWYGSVEPENGTTHDIWIAQGSAPSGGGSGDLQAHVGLSTNVHGIVNAANLVYSNDARLLPIIESNPRTSAYTIQTADLGKTIDCTSTDPTAVEITVPASLGSNGSVFEVCQLGTGPVDFVGTGGVSFVSIDDNVTLDNQGAVARFRRLSSTSWHIGGDLSA